ncbi:hypothetical protein ACET3Z_031836 [Daucus carota]
MERVSSALISKKKELLTALELAYGKILAEIRRELLQVASYKCEVKTLTNTWEELRHKSAELTADRALPFRKRKFRDEEATTTSLTTVTEGKFCDR